MISWRMNCRIFVFNLDMYIYHYCVQSIGRGLMSADGVNTERPRFPMWR